MIREAVILAAGLGRRLGDLAGSRPKGFLDIGGVSLIERSIGKLYSIGIERIVIGTGYRDDCYEALAAKDERIVCVRNPEYAETGSMSTLLAASDRISGDFLLLESDILYARLGLTALGNAPADNVILASGATNSGDEVFIETTPGGSLRNMSKNRAALGAIHGELVGITRLSHSALPTLRAVAADLLRRQPRLDYETCLVAAAPKHDIQVLVLDDYPWCEVDTAEHLQRAVSLILDRVIESEHRESS
ncbi:MAG: phosphocholine cytidylyltransferase family protein [Sulfuritalea sp.]|nr:phosphocholine cytidylyltransferase family protein [Sulfuritalea sp.]